MIRKYSTKVAIGERKRGRCGSCSACTRDDCGQCRYCLDMVKFGGPGKKRQACILRKCSEISVSKDLKSKQEDTSLKIPIKPVTGTNINGHVYSYIHTYILYKHVDQDA